MAILVWNYVNSDNGSFNYLCEKLLPEKNKDMVLMSDFHVDVLKYQEEANYNYQTGQRSTYYIDFRIEFYFNNTIRTCVS